MFIAVVVVTGCAAIATPIHVATDGQPISPYI
jgi:hypothetical protein